MFYLYEGNWWLAIQGNWIGYYPGSLYRGGQLAHYATEIQYGTEGVGSNVWPGEGSGNSASAGFGHAAYQRNVYYINLSNSGVPASLKAYEPSPNCYQISGPFYSTTPQWNHYFYEGGPGGPGC
jgi:Neprosin